MCTVVLLRRPGHDWPLIVGANRDEMRDRPWLPPARHWPDRPEVTAGLDELAGGSWMGVNDHGVIAALLNRHGTLGPAQGKRSRGELVLDALDYPDAADAARALAHVATEAYRTFNLIIGDNRDTFWLAHRGDGKIGVAPVPEGVSMITAGELNDPDSSRVRRYRALFAEATAPNPETGDFAAWEALLDDDVTDPALGPGSAMRLAMPNGFGTVSSSIVALPAPGRDLVPVFRFARVTGPSSAWETLGPV